MNYFKLMISFFALLLSPIGVNDIQAQSNTSANNFPKKENELRIVSYNMQHFENANQEIEYTQAAELIKLMDADIVCLQEIDMHTKRSKQHNQMDKISDLTQMHSYFSKSISFQGGEYGNGFLSKEKALMYKQIPLPGEEPRSAIIAEFDKYVVIATHLALESKEREESIEILSKEAAKYKNKVVFLAGDLNENSLKTAFFKKLKKQWKIDSADVLTFPTPVANERLDYILTFKKGAKKVKATQTDVIHQVKHINAALISDHFPIFCDYQFKH